MDDFDFENRIVSSGVTAEDSDNEQSLRPFSLDEYIGQEKAKEILLENSIVIDIDLKSGLRSATAWGCDLSYEYVHINGDYRS